VLVNVKQQSPTRRAFLLRALTLGLLLTPVIAVSVEDDETGFIGFAAGASRTQRALEESFASSLDAGNLRLWLKRMSSRPHHTGSPGGAEVADFIVEKFRSWGFDTKIETFYALMSTPKESVVEMLSPCKYQASIANPETPGDVSAETEVSLPPYNVYSRDGDVTAKAVYVNYGVPEDYEVLARHGIDVKGKIIIARYGKSWRGIKPRLAGEKGAVGAILFSDPLNVGYHRGDVYPAGPFLPEQGYQRGSVMDLPRRAGDPLTPGVGAINPPDSFTLEEVSEIISPIPVLPLSARDIQPILAAMDGPAVPPEWRGALPLTYRFEGTVELHLKVRQNWEIVPLLNVVARLEGETWPDEWVLRGNNHDAWNYGAQVALSGLVTLMEEARGIGNLTKTGWRPKRTLIYLAWDGEEQGLLGSTEWAEMHAQELQQKAVAYVNSGVTTQGFMNAGGSHSLETLVDGLTKVVRDPKLGATVYERVAARIEVEGDAQQRTDLASTGRYRLTPLGLGSDYTPFLHHLGIPSLDIAFDGEADNGVYHSSFDNFDFYDRFGDPGYEYGVKLAEFGGRVMLRLANADILPFEFSGMAYALSQYVGELQQLTHQMRSDTQQHNLFIEKQVYQLLYDPKNNLVTPAPQFEVPQIDFEPIKHAVASLSLSAERFLAARTTLEASGNMIDPRENERLNAILARAEQALAPQHGLPGRPWYRHHVYAPGYYTGYSVKTLPSVREAIELKNWQEVRKEIINVGNLIEKYVVEINKASLILEQAAM